MSHAMTKQQMHQMAQELESLIPAHGIEHEQSNALFGGLIGKVYDLISALKSGDMNAALQAFKALVNILIPDANPTTGVIQFATAAPAAGINWQGLIATLSKWLPIILGLLQQGAGGTGTGGALPHGNPVHEAAKKGYGEAQTPMQPQKTPPPPKKGA